MRPLNRRQILLGGVGIAGTGLLSACTGPSPSATWGLPASGGLRKDTVLVAPMQTIEADLLTDNPGEWMLHCHNIYHAEVGMMTTMRYV